MADRPDLLTHGHTRRGRGGRAVVVVLLVLLAAAASTLDSDSVPPVGLTVWTIGAAGQVKMTTGTATGASAALLARDVLRLTPGRIPCGAPGPAAVTLRFAHSSYDVNGECASVVRLPETRGETVWLESAALHDDLAALIEDQP